MQPLFVTPTEKRELLGIPTVIRDFAIVDGVEIKVPCLNDRPLLTRLPRGVADHVMQHGGATIVGWQIRPANEQETALGWEWIAFPPDRISMPPGTTRMAVATIPMDVVMIARARSEQEVREHNRGDTLRDLLHKIVEVEIEQRPPLET